MKLGEKMQFEGFFCWICGGKLKGPNSTKKIETEKGIRKVHKACWPKE